MLSSKNAVLQKLEFRMKLLSGNNVVMIEANGYESEVFMPQIVNGRIYFQNIIPNRRCCYMAEIDLKELSRRNGPMPGVFVVTPPSTTPIIQHSRSNPRPTNNDINSVMKYEQL